MPFTPASQAPTRPAKVGDPGNLQLLQRIVDALTELREAGLLIGNDLGSGGGGGTTPAEVSALISQALPATALAKLRGALVLRNTRRCRLVFAGSSTTAGSLASAADKRWVNIFIKALQTSYPSSASSEVAVFANPDGAWGTASTALGVQGYNIGDGGTVSGDYLTSAERTIVANLAPAAVFHMVGSNDFRNGVPVATYKTNMQTVLNDLKSKISSPCVHILVNAYERADSAANTGKVAEWSAYAEALRSIAAADPTNVAYVDLNPEYRQVGVVGFGSPDPLQLLASDLVHQNDSGHAFMAELMLNKLDIPRGGSGSAAAAIVAPTLTFSPGNGSFTISMSAPGSGWTSLELFTSTTNSSDLTGGTLSGTSLPATVSGTNGTSYYAQVRVTGAGGTALSNVVSGKPTDGSTPAPFLSDTFTDTDGTALTAHTSDTGQGWTKHPSSGASSGSPVVVSGGTLRQPTASGSSRWISNAVPPTADYKVEADVTLLTTSPLGVWGIGARYSTTSPRDSYYINHSNTEGWTLAKAVQDSTTILGALPVTLATGTTYHLEISVVGTTITGKVNGVTIATVTDSSVTAVGRPAIFVAGGDASTTGTRIDNLTATAL